MYQKQYGTVWYGAVTAWYGTVTAWYGTVTAWYEIHHVGQSSCISHDLFLLYHISNTLMQSR